MRLPKFLRALAAAPQGDLTAPSAGEAGADGDAWLNNYLAGGPDVNPALSGPAKFRVYDEMRKTDATVKSMLLTLKLPIRAAHWGLNPRTKDDPVDAVIRDFVACNLGLEGEDGWLDHSWDETLQHALTALDFGCAFEELVWGDVRTWIDEDGDQHLVRPLARLAPRPVSSILRVRRQNGRIVQFVQNVPNVQPIPGDKLSHLIWEREGDRWDGVSVLRPAWGPWWLKKEVMIAAGISWDRFAGGLPTVYHPDNDDGVEKAIAIGENLQHHERGYIHLPKGKGKLKEEADFQVELLNGSATMADPVPLIRELSGQIAEAGLQQAMRQGLGHTGARATAQVQIDPMFLAIQSIAEYVRMQRSRVVIRKLVEVNFGAEAADKHTPILTVSKIQARNVQVLADAISVLEPLGLVLVNEGTVDDVHEVLGLPAPDWQQDALAGKGIDTATLAQAMTTAGVDPATLQRVIAALPQGVGVARNRVPAQLAEGNGYPVGP